MPSSWWRGSSGAITGRICRTEGVVKQRATARVLASLYYDNIFCSLNSCFSSVWSKNSCGVARVVFQEPSEPFATLNRAFVLRVLADRRKEQDVALALMISLVMIMLHVLIEGATQGCFSKQNQPCETL